MQRQSLGRLLTPFFGLRKNEAAEIGCPDRFPFERFAVCRVVPGREHRAHIDAMLEFTFERLLIRTQWPGRIANDRSRLHAVPQCVENLDRLRRRVSHLKGRLIDLLVSFVFSSIATFFQRASSVVRVSSSLSEKPGDQG
jgi:hypothetical protein